MAEKNPTIGTLRWPVTIAARVQTAAGAATISEALTDIATVHADIQPLGPMTYLAGQQTDRPVTHRIYMRWLDWIDETNVIVRASLRTDGTTRTEVFRIRKVAEVAGRKRFVEVLAELESRA